MSCCPSTFDVFIPSGAFTGTDDDGNPTADVDLFDVSANDDVGVVGLPGDPDQLWVATAFAAPGATWVELREGRSGAVPGGRPPSGSSGRFIPISKPHDLTVAIDVASDVFITCIRAPECTCPEDRP